MADKNNHAGHSGMAVGLGLAAVVAAAGAYFLYGSDKAEMRREKVKGWALKMKGEVLERMEEMKEISQESYDSIVTTVSQGYEGLKNVDPGEVKALAADLKKHWKNIQAQVQKGAHKAGAAGGSSTTKSSTRKSPKKKE